MDQSANLDCYTPVADDACQWKLIETSTFTKQIAALLTNEEYRQFQLRLAANPELGAPTKCGGGIPGGSMGSLG
jgi:hypothetical protein